MIKKAKMAAIGLAAALSLVSTGCSDKNNDGTREGAKQEQRTNRVVDGKENITLSYIKGRDYIYSVNLLLSLHDQVTREVQKNYGRMGIKGAMQEAYSKLRQQGSLKDNSVAFNFVDVVQMNYGIDGNSPEDFEKWAKRFMQAGSKADEILSAGADARKFVPAAFQGEFLRRPVEGGEWRTCWEMEQDYSVKKYARQYYGGNGG